MKIKQQRAFTLIELMVVVAIIAILASMGVANFSTAIIKARNSVRMNDVMAISKSMEVCYNLMNAVYWPEPGTTPPTGRTGNWASQFSGANAETPFKAGQNDLENKCLSEDLVPAMRDFNYGIKTEDIDSAQKYVACAQLEYVGGWETLGNVQGFVGNEGAGVPTYSAFTGLAGATRPPACDPNDKNLGCMFCVASSQ